MKKYTLLPLIALLFVACSSTTEPATDLEISVDDELDKATIIEAVTLQSLELCDTVSDANKEYCNQKVQESITTDEAKAELDIEKCKQIEDEKTQKRCEILTQSAIDEANRQLNLNETQTEIAEIVEKGDIEDCQKIEAKEFQEQCETNIYLNKATEEKDPALCEKISNEELAMQCKNAISSSEEN